MPRMTKQDVEALVSDECCPGLRAQFAAERMLNDDLSAGLDERDKTIEVLRKALEDLRVAVMGAGGSRACLTELRAAEHALAFRTNKVGV